MLKRSPCSSAAACKEPRRTMEWKSLRQLVNIYTSFSCLQRNRVLGIRMGTSPYWVLWPASSVKKQLGFIILCRFYLVELFGYLQIPMADGGMKKKKSRELMIIYFWSRAKPRVGSRVRDLPGYYGQRLSIINFCSFLNDDKDLYFRLITSLDTPDERY